ncbi:MAG: YaiO family outer membrane beta-barrel protein [Candidatus Omnitrophota bacterium]|nr:YaiO family outer membrane beta-barrel protein [Candidatus Omnitrophota bacterium]
MKKYLIFTIIMLLVAPSSAIAADAVTGGRGIVEEQIIEKRLPIAEEKKEKLFFNAFYEYGWVEQGFRKGNWQQSTGRIAYSLNDMMTSYTAFNVHERFHKKDYAIDTGYDFRFGNYAYANTEFSVGADVDYLYRYRLNIDYGHRLYKNLFWEVDSKYLNYRGNDVGLVSPSLVYYFGNHYVSASYGLSLTHTRGAAQWGIFRGNYALTDNLNLWGGMATGQRLYDIYEIDASKQYGYIFYTGLTYRIVKQLDFSAGYSYSKERPNFQKHGINFGLNLKY